MFNRCFLSLVWVGNSSVAAALIRQMRGNHKILSLPKSKLVAAHASLDSDPLTVQLPYPWLVVVLKETSLQERFDVITILRQEYHRRSRRPIYKTIEYVYSRRSMNSMRCTTRAKDAAVRNNTRISKPGIVQISTAVPFFKFGKVKLV